MNYIERKLHNKITQKLLKAWSVQVCRNGDLHCIIFFELLEW